MGGKITVESEEKVGSTFTFSIVGRQLDAEEVASRAERKLTAEKQNSKGTQEYYFVLKYPYELDIWY